MSTENKYYTAFVFKQPGIQPIQKLHVTHAYLGELSIDELKNVKKITDDFFRFYQPLKMPIIAFSKEEFFDNGKVRVLTTENVAAFKTFSILRHIFLGAGYIKSEWPFNPHVTIEKETYLAKPFAAYALMTGRKIIAYWPIEVLL